MENVTIRQYILTITAAFAVLASGVQAEDISTRYGSLAELVASDAYVKAEQVPFERVSESVIDCRFHPGRKMRQIKVTFASQVYRSKRCPHEAIMCLPFGKLAKAA